MEESILRLFRRPDFTPLSPADISRKLGLRGNQQKRLQRTLAELERKGEIARIKQDNRYGLPLEADLIPGRIRMNRQGVGFFQPDDPSLPPIRVPSDATGTAMHGDRVLVRRDVRPRFGKRPGDEI